MVSVPEWACNLAFAVAKRMSYSIMHLLMPHNTGNPPDVDMLSAAKMAAQPPGVCMPVKFLSAALAAQLKYFRAFTRPVDLSG